MTIVGHDLFNQNFVCGVGREQNFGEQNIAYILRREKKTGIYSKKWLE